MIAAAIIAAGGKGTRLGTARPKQYLPLLGVPILVRTLAVFQNSDAVDFILPVVPAEWLEFTRLLLQRRRRSLSKCLEPIAGGRRRQDSVRRGFASLPPADYVVIHDAARPLVTEELIARCVRAAAAHGAAIAASQASQTVKISADGRTVDATMDRRQVWLAQTPQAFRGSLLAELYRNGRQRQEFTDEASMAEAIGHKVAIVPAPVENIKITTAADLALAGVLLRQRLRGKT